MERYLNVRYDDKYSMSTLTKTLKQFLTTLPEIKETGDMIFENESPFPWVLVQLINCKQDGSYLFNPDNFFPVVNLVELACLFDGSEKLDNKYNELAKKIAEFLNWEVVDALTKEKL